VGIRARHGGIFRPIRERLLYRLLLAAVAGWLSAWFLLPFHLFPIPEVRGFFVPGTIFGVLVMVSMLDDSARHFVRAALLVWAATIAHAAIWVTGFAIYDVADTYGQQWNHEARILLLLWAPPGVVFGIIVTAAMSRILNLRFGRAIWFSNVVISGACGIIYVFAVTADWPAWVETLEVLTFDDSPVFFTYVLWYAATAAVFNLGKAQPLAPVTKLDFVFAGGLILITSYVGLVLLLV
jgi:hypothetical protein